MFGGNGANHTNKLSPNKALLFQSLFCANSSYVTKSCVCSDQIPVKKVKCTKHITEVHSAQLPFFGEGSPVPLCPPPSPYLPSPEGF
jgi:hypothetical protein